MFVLHFVGKGYGMNDGVTEMLLCVDGEPTEEDKEPAPGFELESVTETDIDDPPSSFPFDTLFKK
jgi:hypothetical protein